MLSNTFANDLLRLVFNGRAIDGLADNAGAALAHLYMSLHTEDPQADGAQDTAEVNYDGYARVAVARTAAGFTIDGAVMNPTETHEFGEMVGGTNQTATHLCIGTDATGPGKVLFRFALSPTIALAEGVTPRIRSTTTLTAITAE